MNQVSCIISRVKVPLKNEKAEQHHVTQLHVKYQTVMNTVVP